jgi:hypothetical protein
MRFVALVEPRYIFAYYMASSYKWPCGSEFWIEYTDVGREGCKKFTEIRHSILFECYLAHGFGAQPPTDN